jgi:thiol-disulfide isomerase/thioredoxin
MPNLTLHHREPDPDAEDTTPLHSDRMLRSLVVGALALLIVLFGWTRWQGPVEHVDRPLPALPVRLLEPVADASVAGMPEVIHVWLPGCGACAAEAAAYEVVRARYAAQGVRFLSVSIVSDPAATRRAAAAYGLGGPLASTTGNLLEALQLDVVPSTVWISKEGRVVSVGSGALSERVLDRETRRILR